MRLEACELFGWCIAGSIDVTWYDVIVVDLNVLVTIRSALLVPSSESVEDLVYDNALVSAAITDRDVLGSSDPADVGVAPARKKNGASARYLILASQRSKLMVLTK